MLNHEEPIEEEEGSKNTNSARNWNNLDDIDQGNGYMWNSLNDLEVIQDSIELDQQGKGAQDTNAPYA